MVITMGKVIDGKVVVEGNPLPEGKTVGVFLRGDSDMFDLGPEDETELIDRIVSAESGNFVDGDEYLRKLRAGG